MVHNSKGGEEGTPRLDPKPITRTDEILLLLLAEVRGLRADLHQAASVPAEVPARAADVDLQEPAVVQPTIKRRR